MIVLRDYQLRADAELKLALRTCRKAVLMLPTGGGKGILIGHILHAAWAKGKRIMAAAHRGEILQQITRHLAALGVPHSPIQSGKEANHDHPVQIASIQTLARRMDRLPAIDILLIDEVHHANAKTWRAIIEAYPDAIVIGFSATPTRLDGQGLGSVGFEKLIVVAQVHELIEQGYLVPPRIFCPPGPSFRKVSVVAGDFSPKQSAAIMDRPRITGDIVQHWLELAPGRPTICFSTGLKHSKSLVEAFRAKGIAAEDVDGGTRDREGALFRFSSGETKILVNCGLYLEGVDLPLCSCVIHGRPTMSPSLAIQITGRALRTHPSKVDAVVIDAVGNVLRHGLPTEPREYSLHGREIRSKENIPSVTTCKKCFAVYASRLGACPACGTATAVKPRKQIETVAGSLVDVAKLAALKWGAQVPREEKIAYLAEQMRVGRAKGYKARWPHVRYNLKFGTWPSTSDEMAAMAMLDRKKEVAVEW